MPIKIGFVIVTHNRAHEITEELSALQYDACLDHREILYGALPPGQTAQDREWVPLAYDRYCTIRLPWLRPSRQLLYSRSFPFRKSYLPLRNPYLNRMTYRFQPDRPSRFYGGSFWFHARPKAIDRLLDAGIMNSLVRYYHNRRIPEESIFHTVLCNQADLRISKDHKRYEDWTGGCAHPKWLDISDLPSIVRSETYFARKFRDQEVLDAIDADLLEL
jgi:hypothetical protein